MRLNHYKIAVLMGGVSAERDVSLVTGLNIARTLKDSGHRVTALDVAYGDREINCEKASPLERVEKLQADEAQLKLLRKNIFKTVNYLGKEKFDLAFIALHGGYGENGQLQAMLELAEIPFTGASSASSVLSMDKDISKILVSRAGVPVAGWKMIHRNENLIFPEQFGFPVVVKPNDQGSTVGLTIVEKADAFSAAVQEAQKFSDRVMVEEYIPGKELTVSVLGGKTLPTIDIQPISGFYDYESKYQSGKTNYVVPAEIPEAVNEKIHRWSKTVFETLLCRHYGRVDFRYDPETGRICFLELNTLPGMTSTSLVPKAAKSMGIQFNELLEEIITSAMNETRGR